ncbi:EEF2KMT [Acanthosepion pharaonis]|uniref:EEF2KMT n=1 Tax=Acanthosepion pharaonis TaxID=158019 RepID=A0A812CWU5_ACAPH|nr:EEF2KMT [Sepia pharaonis]
MAASVSGSSLEDKLLEETATQFFEMVPIRRMKWGNYQFEGSEVGPDTQRKVLTATVTSPLCEKYPPSLSYQRSFMKHFVHKLETCDAEICDEVYEAYTDILSQKEEEDDTLCYKTYSLPYSKTVSLQESVHLVAQGTTGLSTWQAAQHLAEWAIENIDVFQNKKILELGSGLGLTGIVICKHCLPAHFCFTDCHPQVLYLLSKNIELNFISNNQNNDTQNSTQKDIQLSPVNSNNHNDEKIMRKIRRQLSLSADNNPSNDMTDIIEICVSPTTPPGSEEEAIHKELINELADFELHSKLWKKDSVTHVATLKKCEKISIAKLDWESFDDNLLSSYCPEVIVAADVVYDTTIIPSLVLVLKTLLSLTLENGQKPVAYIASTVRHEDTRDQFLFTLGVQELHFESMVPPSEYIFHYDRAVPIELLKITAM